MTEKQKIVSKMILIVYILELVVLKFCDGKIMFNNIVSMFPIGIFLPRIWESFRQANRLIYAGGILSIFLEIVQITGGKTAHPLYAVICGGTGSLLGYIGYCIGENA